LQALPTPEFGVATSRAAAVLCPYRLDQTITLHRRHDA
jgi:hypothetical protein